MKTLLLILLSVFSLTVEARGPGTDPVIPWPTSVTLRPLSLDELQGNWVAYSDNSIWFIELEMRPDNALSTIRMKSNALFTKKATGWLEFDHEMFFGKIAMDSKHIYNVIVYKDSDGTKIRIVQTRYKYFDLKLYRLE